MSVTSFVMSPAALVELLDEEGKRPDMTAVRWPLWPVHKAEACAVELVDALRLEVSYW